MEFLSTILAFGVAIGVLVTVHEFGHFWVARKLGVKVLRFSVGFGAPIWTRRGKVDDTEYVIAAVPLGGYVKMLDESEGDVAPHELDRAFNRKSLAVRTAVVVAGPVFNFLFAVIAYALMFMVGVSGLRPIVGAVGPGSIAETAGLTPDQEIVTVQGEEVRSWDSVVRQILTGTLDGGVVDLGVVDPDRRRTELSLDIGTVSLDDLTHGKFFDAIGIEPKRPRIPAVLGELTAGDPAESAGMRPGDLVVAADGEPIADWSAWVDFVRARPGKTFSVEVERDGALLTLELTPVALEGGDGKVIGRIGAGVDSPDEILDGYYVTERYGPLESLQRGVGKTADLSILTVKMLWKMLKLEVSVQNLSGPISIAQYAGASARYGLARFLEFLGIVSVSLGILNLLPIPLLDGGHLLYYGIEFVRGRPVSETVLFFGQRIGVMLLVGLMGLAFYNDLARLFG